MSSPRPCPDCGERPPRRKRGLLCAACYHRRRRGTTLLPDREPTEGELEQMIAEQMRCLPSWWSEDVRDQARDCDDTYRRVAGALRYLITRKRVA